MDAEVAARPAQQRLAVGPVGQSPRMPAIGRAFPGATGLRAQADAGLLPADRVGAQHQAREIELEFVPVIRRVRALDVAEFALVAGVDDAVGFLGVSARTSPSCWSDGLEQFGERRAQIEAQAAAVADLVDALISG